MKVSYNKLWKLLIDRNLNKTMLASLTGISSVSVAKLGRDQAVNLSTLMRICEVLGCNIDDVVDFVPDDTEVNSKGKKRKKSEQQGNIGTVEAPLRLATVFSGIGAIEQALLISNIPHEIVFACDNGERYLPFEYEDILQQIKGLSASQKREYIQKLYDDTKKENLVKKSYFANYQIDEDSWFEDIRFLDGWQFHDKVDIIMGGSPCQSFSTYGNKMGLEDVRGTLFYDYARLVNEIQPKAFIFENVLGLLTHDNKKTWNAVQSVFRSLNYDIKMDILNAADFNLPQLRKRVFVVGIRKNLGCVPFEFPRPVELTCKSTDFLEQDIPDKYYLGEKGFDFVTRVERSGRRARVNQDVIGCQTANQQFNWVGDFRAEPPKPQHYQNPKIFIGKYNGQDAVVRKMLPQELLRLMGFQKFNIVVDDNTMWRQTGNSVAVPVLQALLPQIIKTINTGSF